MEELNRRYDEMKCSQHAYSITTLTDRNRFQLIWMWEYKYGIFPEYYSFANPSLFLLSSMFSHIAIPGIFVPLGYSYKHRFNLPSQKRIQIYVPCNVINTCAMEFSAHPIMSRELLGMAVSRNNYFVW